VLLLELAGRELLIILVLGFGALAALGVWLKRRHSSNRQHHHSSTQGHQRKATSSGMFSVPVTASGSAVTNEMWGSHQATRSFDIAPVEDPPQMVGSSRTASSSTNTLIASTPRAMTTASKRSTSKLRDGADNSTQETTEIRTD